MSFLPGMASFVPTGAGVITLVDWSVADADGSGSFTLPDDISARDLILFLNMAGSGSAPSAVTPSEFDLDINVASATFRFCVSSKIADGDEGGTAIGCMLGSITRNAALVYRRSGGFSSVTRSAAVGTEFTSGDPSAQTILASEGASPVIALAHFLCHADLGEITTLSFSPTADDEVKVPSAQSTAHILSKIFMTSPQNVSVDLTDEGGVNMMHSWYYEVT